MMTFRARAPRTSSRRNSSLRAFDTRASAESTQAMSPPIGTRQMATISAAMWAVLIGCSSASPAGGVADLPARSGQRGPDGAALGHPRPLLDEPRLQLEHLPLLLRLGVVVAEQVQDAVGAEQVQLGLGRVAGRGRLVRR